MRKKGTVVQVANTNTIFNIVSKNKSKAVYGIMHNRTGFYNENNSSRGGVMQHYAQVDCR